MGVALTINLSDVGCNDVQILYNCTSAGFQVSVLENVAF